MKQPFHTYFAVINSNNSTLFDNCLCLHLCCIIGTQGRLKAPWRRTRFERLADDVTQLHQQSVLMHMAVEEALTRAVNTAVQEDAAVMMVEEVNNTAEAEANSEVKIGQKERKISERVTSVVPLVAKSNVETSTSASPTTTTTATATTSAPVEAFRRPRSAAGIVQVARPPAYVPRTPPTAASAVSPAAAGTNSSDSAAANSTSGKATEDNDGSQSAQTVSRPVSATALSGTRSPLLLQLPSPQRSPLPQASSPHTPHSVVPSANPSTLTTPNLHLPATAANIANSSTQNVHTISNNNAGGSNTSNSGSEDGTDEELSDLDDAASGNNEDNNNVETAATDVSQVPQADEKAKIKVIYLFFIALSLRSLWLSFCDTQYVQFRCN